MASWLLRARYGLLKPSRNNSKRLTWDNSDFDRRKSDQDLEAKWNLEGAKYGTYVTVMYYFCRYIICRYGYVI